MFVSDIEANKEKLAEEIKGKKVCVIGGAGSICSCFIKAVLCFELASVVVVERNVKLVWILLSRKYISTN
jgi:FlaA1/EpsC-like NDP-sugar epimerase